MSLERKRDRETKREIWRERGRERGREWGKERESHLYLIARMHHELRVIVHITPEEFLISQDSSNFLMPRGEFAKHRRLRGI